MRTLSLKLHDKMSIFFLIFGVPIFFPKIFRGLIPGPFSAGVSDSYIFFEPYALSFVHALKEGQNPFWSHLSSFGSPTLLTLGTGALHPFHLFHLIFPDWLAFALGWWARFALFGVYFYSYLRLRSVRPWIALAFTLGLSFGSFFINYSLEIIGYVVCFFPMALCHADKICSGEKLKIRDFFFLGLAVACMILGGFPSVILYLLLALGFYILFMSVGSKELIFSVLACCFGLYLVLPALLETFGFYPTTGYSIEQRKALFFYTPPSITALNLIIPSLFGNITEYHQAGMRDFYGRLLGAGVLTIPLVFILTLYSIVKKHVVDKDLLFWLIVLCITLTAYFDLFYIKQVLKYVFVINEHPLTRLQVLITVSASISAPLLLESMLRNKVKSHSWKNIFYFISAVLFGVYLFTAYSQEGDKVLINCLMYGSITLLSIISLTYSIVNSNRFAIAAFVSLSILLGIVTTNSYTYYYKPKDYYPKNSLIDHIEKNLVPGARVLDIQNILFKNTSVAYNIPSLTNHWFSPPNLRSWVSNLSSDGSLQGLTLDSLSSINDVIAWPELRRMHVQFVSAPEKLVQKWNKDKQFKEWRIVISSLDGISLVEVLYSGQALKEKGSLLGDGYSDYVEWPGYISLRPNLISAIIPVRFHKGWRISSGNAQIRQSKDNLIIISNLNNKEAVILEYHPQYLSSYFYAGIALFSALFIFIFYYKFRGTVFVKIRNTDV